jgi:hypothetical protein
MAAVLQAEHGQQQRLDDWLAELDRRDADG